MGDSRPYVAVGAKDKTAAEYENFCGCVAQLLDDKSLTGDLEGQWVIFKDGWVYGMAAYRTQRDAEVFARQIFRDEPNASYIVVEVDLEKHDISPLAVLASALSDVEFVQRQEEQERLEDEDDSGGESE